MNRDSIINYVEERLHSLHNRRHFKRGPEDDLLVGRVQALEEVLDYLNEIKGNGC